MHMGIICVFSGKRQQNTKYFCRTYPAVFCHFCRTNLALSDISRDFWSFLSDTSSCGHIWLCRTYLAGTGPTVLTIERLDVSPWTVAYFFSGRCIALAIYSVCAVLPVVVAYCIAYVTV